MKLDWNIGGIKGSLALWEPNAKRTQERLNPVTDALVWATLVIGMNRITRRNWRRFAARVLAAQAVLDPLVLGLDGDGNLRPALVTPADVERHIGLRTSAPCLTAAQFERKIAYWTGSKCTGGSETPLAAGASSQRPNPVLEQMKGHPANRILRREIFPHPAGPESGQEPPILV